MTILSIENLSKTIANKSLFENATFGLDESDRKLLSERIAGSSERLRQLEAMSANKGCNQLRLSVQN